MRRLHLWTMLIIYSYHVTPNSCNESLTTASCASQIAPIIDNLETIKATQLFRLILLPTLLAIVGYVHQKKIFDIINYSPLSFIAISYITGNYFIDTIYQYRRINQSLNTLGLSKTITYYMLCIVALKNSLCSINQNIFVQCEEIFCQKIKNILGCSFEELENFTIQIMYQNMHILNTIYNNQYMDQTMTDNLYILLKDTITIQQLLDTSHHDRMLYQTLKRYMIAPEKEFESTLEYICHLIKKHLTILIKKTSHSSLK